MRKRAGNQVKSSAPAGHEDTDAFVTAWLEFPASALMRGMQFPSNAIMDAKAASGRAGGRVRSTGEMQ